MLKSKIFSLLAAVLFVPILVLALSSKPAIAQDDLESETVQLSGDEINKLAQKIVDNDIDVVEVEKIYISLTHKQQVELLETVGVKQGLSIEVLQDKDAFDPGSQNKSLALYPELIEHRTTWCWNCAYFASYYYTDYMCDNDPSDTDYVFRFGRPPGSPSTYRASDHLSSTVWAMLAWYQSQYGGINAHNINNYSTYVCLGDNGVLYGGGLNHIQAHLAIYHQ